MNILKSFLDLFRKKDETREVLEQLESYAKTNRDKNSLRQVTNVGGITVVTENVDESSTITVNGQVIDTKPKRKKASRKKKTTTEIKKDQA